MKSRRVFFEKEGRIALLACDRDESGSLVGSYDERFGAQAAYAARGSKEERDFDGEVQITEGRGWRKVWDGARLGNPNLN